MCIELQVCVSHPLGAKGEDGVDSKGGVDEPGVAAGDFDALPPEMMAVVIQQLGREAALNLRATCRVLNALVMANYPTLGSYDREGHLGLWRHVKRRAQQIDLVAMAREQNNAKAVEFLATTTKLTNHWGVCSWIRRAFSSYIPQPCNSKCAFEAERTVPTVLAHHNAENESLWCWDTCFWMWNLKANKSIDSVFSMASSGASFAQPLRTNKLVIGDTIVPCTTLDSTNTQLARVTSVNFYQVVAKPANKRKKPAAVAQKQQKEEAKNPLLRDIRPRIGSWSCPVSPERRAAEDAELELQQRYIDAASDMWHPQNLEHTIHTAITRANAIVNTLPAHNTITMACKTAKLIERLTLPRKPILTLDGDDTTVRVSDVNNNGVGGTSWWDKLSLYLRGQTTPNHTSFYRRFCKRQTIRPRRGRRGHLGRARCRPAACPRPLPRWCR
jgi:hypothetical protein